MELDIVKVKEWIVGAVKRAAIGDAYMPSDAAEAAFEILADIDRKIVVGECVYVDIYVPDGDDLRISQKEFDEIQKEVDLGRKIQAIKELRACTQCGLRDAKYAVEASGNWNWVKYREINYRPGSTDSMCQ